MEEENKPAHVRKEKPPLRKIRTDIEEDKLLISIPFTNLEEYPDLSSNFRDITDGVNEARNRYDLPAMQFAASDVRFIDATVFDAHHYLKKIRESRAFFDPITDFVFIRFDDQKFLESRSEKVKSSYILAHEITHKGMGSGLRAYSTDLDEGLTDWIARDIMQKRILPKYLTQQDHIECGKFISEKKPELEGIAITPDDILLVEPEKSPVKYGRIPEMRLIEKIKTKHPDAFHQLMRNAFHGDDTAAEETIWKIYGPEVSIKLRSEQANFTTFIEEL